MKSLIIGTLMKVTKNSRSAANRIKKLKARAQRGKAKKDQLQRTKQMQSVKMRLSLSNKDGHVSSIREYLGTIEQDITQFSNGVSPAIELMDMICNDQRLKPWIENNREVVLTMQEEIGFVEDITKQLRVVRDEAVGELATFQATEFEDREAMIQFAYGIILRIASTAESAREQFENIGGQLLERVLELKPQLEAFIEE